MNPSLIRHFHINEGVPSLSEMRREVEQMTRVLMGHEDPPVEMGVITLMEVASAYYARASELTMYIQRAETDGTVLKNSKVYKFRTGELRTFMEMCKNQIDLGSRRITQARLEFEMDREML